MLFLHTSGFGTFIAHRAVLSTSVVIHLGLYLPMMFSLSLAWHDDSFDYQLCDWIWVFSFVVQMIAI
jgi:hypothetical protein